MVSFLSLCSCQPREYPYSQIGKAIRTEHKCMRYVIRVKGHLDTFWQEWFENLSITHERDGTTLLSGPIKDQAALYGILFKMRDLGLTLLELSASAPIEQPEEGAALNMPALQRTPCVNETNRTREQP